MKSKKQLLIIIACLLPIVVAVVFGAFWLTREAEFQIEIINEAAEGTDVYRMDFRVTNIGSKKGAARCAAIAYAGDPERSYGKLSESIAAAADLELNAGESREISFGVFISDNEADSVHRSKITCLDWSADTESFDPERHLKATN